MLFTTTTCFITVITIFELVVVEKICNVRGIRVVKGIFFWLKRKRKLLDN